MLPESVWQGPYRSSTDQNGDFHIAGIIPGQYYAAAWVEIEPGLTYNSDFLKRFESQATAVTLEEGAHQTAQPKLISREEAVAEAAKLPYFVSARRDHYAPRSLPPSRIYSFSKLAACSDPSSFQVL